MHAHHGMHLVLATSGELEVQLRGEEPRRTPGILTGPDISHAIDTKGLEVLVVFFDPESRAGTALDACTGDGVRLLTSRERDCLVDEPRPTCLQDDAACAWHERAAKALGAELQPRRAVHPKVKTALRIVRDAPLDADLSLARLAAEVGLSTSRFMHVFTESVGTPLRPYLAWVKVQRAAGAILGGMPLSDAATMAGFSDAAHMSRTFRRMLGIPPSALQGSGAAAS